jgi:hypothetical protein
MADRNIATDLSAAGAMILEDVKALFAPVAPVLSKVAQDFDAARLAVKAAFEKTAVDATAFAAYMKPATDAVGLLGQSALAVGQVALASVVEPLKMVGRVAFDLTAGFAAVTGAAALFVSASNPGEMILFTRAIEDARASIGVFLEPLIQAGTVVLDSFNRMFTELQPILLPVFELLGTAMKDVADIAIALFQPVLEALAPAMMTLLEAIRPLAPPLAALAAAVGDFVGLIVNTFAAALEMVLPTMTDLLRGLADVLTTTITTIQVVIERLRNWDFAGAMNIGSALAEARERMAAREEERLRRRAGTGPGTVAARTPQLIGIEELGVQARLAAFGARTAESQRDLMIRSLQRIEANTARPNAGAAVAAVGWAGAGNNALQGGAGGAMPQSAQPAPAPTLSFAGITIIP